MRELSFEECLEALRKEPVGRVGFVIDDQGPFVLPVNYRFVETSHARWIALRTREGGPIDQPGHMVAFEIDGVDRAHKRGWSVLVRGTMARVDPDAASFRDLYDSAPWVSQDRDSWLVIEPFQISGRAIEGDEPEWAFVEDAYL